MSSNFHDIAESIVDDPEFCALLMVDGLISNRMLATYCISENFSCHKDQPGSVCDKVCTGRNHAKNLLEIQLHTMIPARFCVRLKKDKALMQFSKIF